MADTQPSGSAPGPAAGHLPAGQPSGWHVSIGSVRGAAHHASGLPNQDAVATEMLATPSGAVVVAIADGHGHIRHFRSAVGSALAVTVGCRVGSRLAAGLGARPGQAELDAAVRASLARDIVHDWRDAVTAQIAAHPYTPQEQAALDLEGDGPQIPYGSTLLLAVVCPRWIACAQIGDGDLLAVAPGGQSFFPLPGDDQLDGQHTTSLCQPDALRSFRVGVHDLDGQPLLALLLATDGYGNSQVADPWQVGVGRDLAAFAAEHQPGWFDEQVPLWAQRCASADGSGDDTTVALMLNPDAAALAARPGGTESWQTPAGQATLVNIPPVPAQPDTVPHAVPPQPAMAPVPRGPAVAQRAATGPAAAGPDHRQPSRRRTGRVLAAVVVVAALAAGAVMLMSHRSVHRGRTPAPGPTASNGKGSAGSSPASTTVTVKDPGTGGATTVPLPAKVTAAGPVTASIEVGSDAFVLAGDRVWRVPLPGSPVRPVLNTTALTGPAGPLRLSVSGQLTLSGSNGRVTYVIDPGSLTVCAASSATAASVCGSTVSQQNRGS